MNTSQRAIAAVLLSGLLACDSPLSPSSSQRGVRLDRIWFTPNIGSRDFLELFTRGSDWVNARSKLQVFQFHHGNVQSAPCAICGPNVLSALLTVVPGGAFKWLPRQGLRIAIEAGAVKGCGDQLSVTAGAREAVGNIVAGGGEVSYLSMDEPFTNGKVCRHAPDVTAGSVERFIADLHAMFPRLRIGLTEAYPFSSIDDLKQDVAALEAAGVQLPYLHLDIDRRHAEQLGKDVGADLRELQAFCAEHRITFGVIVWGQNGSSNLDYYNDAMQIIGLVAPAIGLPPHLTFQSWADYPLARPDDLRLYPDNLPETARYTHTELINSGLAVFGR
jgi:hypothetical protein